MRAREFITEEEWTYIKPSDLPRPAKKSASTQQKQTSFPKDDYQSSSEAKRLNDLKDKRDEIARRSTIMKGQVGGSDWSERHPPAQPIPQEKRIQLDPKKLGWDTKDREWVFPDKPFSDEYATVAKERPLVAPNRMPGKDVDNLDIRDYPDFYPAATRKKM